MSEPHQQDFRTLDKDLDRLGMLELGARQASRGIAPVGLALTFLGVVAWVAAGHSGFAHEWFLVVLAALFAGYLALTIGANDVANNMGPVVGSRAMTMGGALILAALAESAGALLAGWDVIDTIAEGVLLPSAFQEAGSLVLAMLAALIATAVWLNVATWAGLSVSATHSLVGGVMGAGIVAAGFGAVNWPVMGKITLSWLLAPVAGGLLAAAILAFIKPRVIYAEDRILAARAWVPVLIGVMVGVFAAYLGVKGLARLVQLSGPVALVLGLGMGLLAWQGSIPLVRRWSEGLENKRKSLKKLFRLPLILAGALLSFGHGANDVSNAVGPVVAIFAALGEGRAQLPSAHVPQWIMIIGALGISLGLLLFGPRLIRLVGSEITKLNPVRAFCVALATAVVVIVASWAGLPVSSTHIAVGAIFGVGFYREYYAERRARSFGAVRSKPIAPEERRRRKLVRRFHVISLSLAWMVTVPLTAAASAGVYQILTWAVG